MNTTVGESSRQAKKKTNRKWGVVQDVKLVGPLLELVNHGGWRADNGTFKSGYLVQLEKILDQKIPGSGLKAQPHIESREKLLKKQYHAITEMLGPNCNGFGWHDTNKCVICDEDVFKEWVKSHPNAQGLRNKPFPHFEDLCLVFGRDCATRLKAETPGDVEEIEEQARQQTPPTPPVGENPELDDIDEETNSLSDLAGSSTQPSKTIKKARTETSEVVRELTSEMTKLGNLMASAGEHIGKLATCFKHESAAVDRRVAVVYEIVKVPGLAQADIIKVGRKIATRTIFLVVLQTLGLHIFVHFYNLMLRICVDL